MKVYMLTQEDFEKLRLLLKQDANRGRLRNDDEKRAIEEAYRYFNYHVETWINEVTK